MIVVTRKFRPRLGRLFERNSPQRNLNFGEKVGAMLPMLWEPFFILWSMGPSSPFQTISFVKGITHIFLSGNRKYFVSLYVCI